MNETLPFIDPTAGSGKVAKVVIRRKEHYSKPALDTLIEEMANEVDVAVAAVGG